MQHQPFTPAQKEKIKKREERRRRERRQREAEYRRRIERLRRQIDAARKRRQRMLLLFLLAVLAMQESFLAAFMRSHTYQPDPEPTGWTPDPASDYAPRSGHDDHCDGYSYKQWTRMTAERGIQMSRKAELKSEWMADPERELFPTRYKDWSYRPFLGEIMNDLSEQRYQSDALEGLKLLSPSETHKYLDEIYAINPLNLLHCRAELSADIVRNFQSRSVLWDEQKRREAEQAKRDKELSRKNDGDKGIPEPK
ncbi:hypothetical protein GGQ73_001634 [Rhizobium skierniewicense]|uniref:Uncharacterized protein n=1 Tax=Rhizobium skierniewicense TaxID=984260 RepID=A0A7W6C7C0_9HYPH|nr:hypothetical protein [Rhizobium skierniewicense]MBB3945699.1 hypothetical protein [Rhizobium skierniewicense]